MKALPRIFALYTNLDTHLEMERAKGERDMSARQVLNDQAYFLLCWGQLEAEIDERCRDAIRRRRSNLRWQVRRAWDIYNPEDPRLSGLGFEERTRLVLDGQAGRGSPFALVVKHYGIRNQIAHGKLQATRISVSAFVQDCSIIQTALHRAT